MYLESLNLMNSFDYFAVSLDNHLSLLTKHFPFAHRMVNILPFQQFHSFPHIFSSLAVVSLCFLEQFTVGLLEEFVVLVVDFVAFDYFSIGFFGVEGFLGEDL